MCRTTQRTLTPAGRGATCVHSSGIGIDATDGCDAMTRAMRHGEHATCSLILSDCAGCSCRTLTNGVHCADNDSVRMETETTPLAALLCRSESVSSLHRKSKSPGQTVIATRHVSRRCCYLKSTQTSNFPPPLLTTSHNVLQRGTEDSF